jgi:hypothetical protein
MENFLSFLDAVAIDYTISKNNIDGKLYQIELWSVNLKEGVQRFKTINFIKNRKELVAKL